MTLVVVVARERTRIAVAVARFAVPASARDSLRGRMAESGGSDAGRFADSLGVALDVALALASNSGRGGADDPDPTSAQPAAAPTSLFRAAISGSLEWGRFPRAAVGTIESGSE